MYEKVRKVCVGKNPGTVETEEGEILTPPVDWVLLPPGDGALTKLVKNAGPHWLVQEKKGRRIFSKGVWASGETVEKAKVDLEEKRSDPGYLRKRESDLKRREKKHKEYENEFFKELLKFLNFHPRYINLAQEMAKALVEHSVPVGSGTVARTKQIPIEKRASAAVIAWMRHKTTGYEYMTIPRVKGKRREVRRDLAKKSIELLDRYRRGEIIKSSSCMIRFGLKK